MDSGRVLVALQEQEKWRDRRERLLSRLRSARARKRYLQQELSLARRRAARLEEVLMGLKDERLPQQHPIAMYDHIKR